MNVRLDIHGEIVDNKREEFGGEILQIFYSDCTAQKAEKPCLPAGRRYKK